MKKIILVVGDDDRAAQARVLELTSAKPVAGSSAVQTRTPNELHMALSSGHIPVIRTLRAILPVREENLRRTYPHVEVEVVDLDG